MYHIKNDKRSRQSSELMYQALRDLMQEKEHHEISVTELVLRAGVGRATFYRAFDNTSDILHMKCDQQMEELYQLLSGQPVGIEHMRDGMKSFLGYWYNNSEILELLYKAGCYDIMLNSFNHMFQRLMVERGIHGSVPEKFTEYVYAIQSGAVLGLLMHWFNTGKNILPEEMSELMDRTMRSNSPAAYMG